MILDGLLNYIITQGRGHRAGTVVLSAQELASFHAWNSLRLVRCDDGTPKKVGDLYPLILSVWREDDKDGESRVYVVSEDDSKAAFVLGLQGSVVVTA